MSRKPMSRTSLDVREWFEVPHPDKGPRDRVYRNIIGGRLADGRTIYACALCAAAYSGRDGLSRHLKRDHGRESATASIAAGRTRFHVDPPAEPAPAEPEQPEQPEQAPDNIPDLAELLAALGSMADALATDCNRWRDRALKAEHRLAVLGGALRAPTSALPVIEGGDDG